MRTSIRTTTSLSIDFIPLSRAFTPRFLPKSSLSDRSIAMKFIVAAVAFVAATLATATPIADEARDIWNPKMTYPHNGTVWASGTTQNVTWYALTHCCLACRV